MTRLISRVVLAVAMVCLTSVASMAQTTATSTETKTFEIVAVDGNLLVVRMPEGTREVNVPPDFRFTVNGQQLAVGQLKAGMKGTATITTKTTYTPVTVTEVKNGTVMQSTGTSIIVRTDEGIKMFSQQELDKRGVRLMRDGKPAQLSQFRQGDQLSATIITSMPPRVMTEKEVQATTSTAAAAAKAPAGASSQPRRRPRRRACRHLVLVRHRRHPRHRAGRPRLCRRPRRHGRSSHSLVCCRSRSGSR